MIKDFNNLINQFKLNGYNHTVMECIPGGDYRVHTFIDSRGMVLLCEHENNIVFSDYVELKCRLTKQKINS